MRRLFLISVLCSLILGGCGQGGKEPLAVPLPSVERPVPSSPERADASPNSLSTNTDTGIVPSELAIPAIGVDAKVISLGLTKQGAMDVPTTEEDVGWFKPGYRPGISGHAVIAGHVDTKTGPAVFYKLKQLKKGDKIVVKGQDGNEKVFRVVGSKAYPYDKAPLNEIFGPSDQPLLNLITCTGLYSKSKGTHQQRLVVTAELVS
ncbi:MAG: class sortase [Cohnella sp.]|nr:class sortase [Cohnella sp.]